MKFNFRKISAIGSSLLMTGMTAGFAAAVDYGSFANPGVAIIYGSNADSIPSGLASQRDLVKAGEVRAEIAAQAPTSSGTVTGESYQFEKPSKKYHIGDNFQTIQTNLDDDQLPTLLADGTYLDNDNDEFKYRQKIEMGNTPLVMFDDNDYADNSPTVGKRFASGTRVLNYTLTFSEKPLIADLVNSYMYFAGKRYYVLSNGSSGANLKLTLLDSAASTTVKQQETITVDGRTVSISFVSSSEVVLVVNGEETNSLSEGETQKMGDGVYVGVEDIQYDPKDNGISQVKFSIGSGKLELTSGSEVKINDDTINGIKVVMVNSSGTILSSTGTLSSIEIEWTVDDDMFLTEDSPLTMPGFEIVKLIYNGLDYSDEERINVEQGSSTYIMLNNFPLKDGEMDIPLLYGASGSFTGLGKDATNRLVSSNATSVHFDKDTDEMILVSYRSTTECETVAIKATGFGTDGSSNNITTIQAYKDGAWTDIEEDVQAGDTFSVGQAELGISFVQRSPVNTVQITANSSETKFDLACSAKGLEIKLPKNITHTAAVPLANAGEINFSGTNSTTAPAGHNNNTFYLQMTEKDKDDNIAAGDQFNVSLGWDSSSTAEPEVADVIGEDVAFAEIGDTDVFRSFMYSATGSELLLSQPNGPDSFTALHRGVEVAADVRIVAPDATVDSSSSVLFLTDNEVNAISQGMNVVIMGGSCINKMAAKLVGSDTPVCGDRAAELSGVGPGMWGVKSYASNTVTDGTALWIFGHEVEGTEKAAAVATDSSESFDPMNVDRKGNNVDVTLG